MYRSRKDWETLVKEDDMDVVLPQIKHLLSLCLKRGSADTDKLVAGLRISSMKLGTQYRGLWLSCQYHTIDISDVSISLNIYCSGISGV